MSRTKGNHEARRRDVSEAVWRVLVAHGFGGLTMRAVAAELDATTGLLTHYFPTKRDLLAYALDLLERRSASRPRRAADTGLPAVRAALLDILPLTDEATDSNRIWVSSWDAALANPELSGDYARKYAQSRDKLCDLVAAAQQFGELPDGDPARIAAGCPVLRARSGGTGAVRPPAFPPHRQAELLDDYLATLTFPPSSRGHHAASS